MKKVWIIFMAATPFRPLSRAMTISTMQHSQPAASEDSPVILEIMAAVDRGMVDRAMELVMTMTRTINTRVRSSKR